MKHITSKLLSLLLTLTMLMSMVPAAYATDTESTGMDDVSISGENVEPYEGETETPVSGSAVATSEELATAIANAEDGATITLSEGEFTLQGSQSIYTGKSLTIKAADNAKVSFDMSAAVTLGGAKITFDGITFDYKTNGNYIGLQHADTLVYNNCTINGMVFLYAASETFNGCTFNQTSANAYNVWTYGAKNVAFNGCKFNCVGKSVLLYNEGANDGTNLTVSNTEFIASAPVEGKAAIEIDTHLMSGGSTVTVDDTTTATGFAMGSNSDSPLWNDKTQTADTNKNTTVIVAGETVFAPATQSTAVAKVDNVEYSTLQAAIDAAKGGSTVLLMDNVTLTEPAVFPAGKTVHINLWGHNITAAGLALLINGKTDIQSTGSTGTIESTGSAAVAVGDNANLTVYSGTLKGREGAVITGTSTGAKIEIRTTKPTLIATDNAVIAGNGSARDGNPNTILVKGGTFEGSILSNGYIACGIYAPWNDNVTVSGGTFNIANGAGIVARAGTVKVTGGTFNCGDGTAKGWVGDSKNKVPCAALVFDEAANYPALTLGSKILVSGGSFSTDPAANGATLADGYVAAKDESGLYKVEKKNPVAEINGVKYGTLQAAINAAQATKGGATITLLKNINTESYYTVNGDNPVTIDLAGYNITGSGISGLFYVTAKGDLTIKGEGTVTAVEDNGAAMAVWVRSPIAKVTLEGGTYKQQITSTSDNHFDLIYVEYGTAYIKGGTYECYTPAWTLNCKDENYKSGEAKIEVTGGTFKGFNPANNTAEGESTSFIPAGYEVVKNEDGTFGVTESANYVAAIGETKYTSLAEAIAAAKNGATVTLLADTKEDVTINKNITLDLNGKTLTNTNADKATLTVAAGATATVKNGSIVGGTSYYTIQNNGTATFEDVTATAGNTDSSMIDNWGTLTIESGDYSGGLNVVKSEEGSKLTINGGKFTLDYAPSSGYTATILVYGDTTITGGEFIQNATPKWGYPQVVMTGVVEGYTSITRVTGGTFTNKKSGDNIFHGLGKATSANFEVSGGTFNKSISDGYCADGFIPTKNADGTYGVKEGKYVAKVGSTKYETLADAIRLAAKGKTVTLLADVTENVIIKATKDMILNLNGHTLSGGTTAGKAALTNYGKLTINDSSEAQTGTIKREDENTRGYYVIDNKGTMTINGGNVINNSSKNGSSLIRNGGAEDDNAYPTLNITGGTFTQLNFIAIKNDALSRLNVSGGKITSNASAIQNWYEATITGGEINGQLWTDAFAWNGGESTGNTTISENAKFTGEIVMDITGENVVPKLNISGGDLNITNWRITPAASAVGAKPAVSGGTFSTAVPEAYCADGYIPTMNADGTFGVKVDTSVAEVNGVKYETLQEAIAAAKDGDTVKLIADVEQNVPLTINKNITLDLNGKKIYNTVDLWDVSNAVISIEATVIITGNGSIEAKENDCYTINVKNGNLTIENGTFVGNVSVVQVENGTLTISGGEFKLLQKWEGSSKYLINCIDENYENKSAVVDIRGGKFVDFDPNVAPEKKVDGKAPSFVISAGIGVTKDAAGNFTAMPNMAAQIVDTDGNSVAAYATLQAAVDAAENGQTVILLADTDITSNGLTIAKGKSITLDLSGHSLKAANTNDGNIKVYGKLTLTDSTDTAKNGTGRGKIYTETPYSYGSQDKVLIAAIDGGTFIMESGLIDAASFATDNTNQGQFAVSVQNENDDATVIINGGHIKAGWYAVAGNGNNVNYNGNITVNGGILESTADYAIYHPHVGTTTINGGTVYGAAGGVSLNRGKLVVNGGMITSKGTGTTGDWGDGTGNQKAAAINVNAQYDTTSVEIKGGTITAEKNAILLTNGKDGTIAVSGGTFSSEVKPEYCAIGFVPKANSDGTYGVKAAEGNAAMFDAEGKLIGYADVEVALKKSEAKTVKLIKDATTADGVVFSNKALDLSGHVLTADYVVAFNGSVIDSEDGKGLLKADNLSFIGDGSNSSYIPLFDQSKVGYRFFVITEMYGYNKAVEGGAQIYCAPTFTSNSSDAWELLKSSNASNAEIGIHLAITMQSGESSSTTKQDVVFDAKFVDMLCNQPTGALWVTIKNVLSVTEGEITSVTATPFLKSNSGAEVTGETYSIPVSSANT